MKNKLQNIFILLMLSLIFVSCGNNYKKDIVGRWENVQKRNIIEFSEGGRFRSGFQSGSFSIEGNKLILDVGRSNLVWEIETLNGSTLKIKDGNEYSRIN